MTDLTAYSKNRALDYVFGGSVYVSLWNGDPQSGGTEVTTSVNVSGRVAATFASASSGSKATSADTSFGASANAVTVTHIGFHDAASSGNLLGSKTVGTNLIAQNAVVKVTSGASIAIS